MWFLILTNFLIKMKRPIKYVIISLLLGISSCTFNDVKFHETHDSLNSFDVENYHNLPDEERSQYLKNSFTSYHSEATDLIVEWQLPFAAGEVDKQLYNDFLGLPKSKSVVFFSGGGEERYSGKIANFIIDNKINLIVPHLCASACAEDILPAAQKLYFFDEPIIAFHGSAQNALFHLTSGKHEDPCPYPSSKVELMEQYQSTVDDKILRYRKTGHNIEFWKEQEQRLKNFSFGVEMKAGDFCLRVPSYTNAIYWLPTSKELKNLLGLKFEGSVCADNKNCYRKKLLLFFGPDKSFVINGEIFTT